MIIGMGKIIMADANELIVRMISQFVIRGFEDNVYNRDRLDENAKQVLLGIKCLVENSKTKKLRIGTYYRARKINTDDITKSKGFTFNSEKKIVSGFNETESGRAPECKTKAGRINKEWESVLYLANDPYTAMAEIKPEVRGQISLACYKPIQNANIRILDFSGSEPCMKKEFEQQGSALEDYNLNDIYVCIQGLLTLPEYNERTYFISNMIADIIKETNVSGDNMK